MEEFPIIKINSFRERNNFGMDEERKKAFLSLDKNSLFLKRVVEIKKREINSITRIIPNGSRIKIKPILNYKNSQKIIKKFENSNQSSIHFPKKEYNSTENIHNKRYENNLDICIKNISIGDINRNPKNQSDKAKNKLNSFLYHKIPMDLLKENSLSPRTLLNKSNTYNNNNTDESETNVLNFKGKRIFHTLSFKDLNNKVISNSAKNIGCEKNCELYRSYNQLKQKKEEIYKRKMKKNNSVQNKVILEIQKDKEIKNKTINLKDNNYKNISIDGNRIRKIPIDRKKVKFYIIREKNHDIIKESYLKKNIPKNMKLNYLLKDTSKNIKYIYSSRDNMNNNYNNIIKDTSKTINNILVNNTEINDNLNILRERCVNYKTLDSNPKNKKKSQTFDKISDVNKYNISKKHFVEDNLNNSIYCSKDKKLMIKIHSIENINQIFLLKRKKKQKLKIERNINIFLRNNIKSYFNYLTNYTIKKPIKLNKNKSLSSIKEEEEKSRIELVKSDLKIEEKTKIIYRIN